MFFSVSVYSEPAIEANKYEIIDETIENDKIVPSAVSEAAADVKAVYADDKGIRAVLISSSHAVGNVLLNGIEYAADTEPDDKGYIYVDIDGAEYSDKVKVYVDGIEEELVPIPVTEANEGWKVSDNGHTLDSYTGNDTEIVVPNFYKGNIITTLGSGECVLRENTAESVVISDGIIDIGDYCFCKMNALKNAVLPRTAEIIGGAAFAFTSLGGNMEIPQSVREIYAYAFSGTDIASVRFNKGLERICSYAFSSCGSMGGTIELPDSLYYIGSWAFSDCPCLTGGITIPSGVTYVGDGAFFNCPKMTGKIVLEEGVEEIGLGAFGADSASKSGFTAVELPASLRKIGPYAFQLAAKIGSLTLPEGLEIISDGAFDHMTGLNNESLTIPSTVRIIGGDYNVDENTGYGGHVFYDMGKNESFRSIDVAEGNQYFTSVDGVLYSKDMTRLVGYPRGKKDEIYEIPEGVTQMDELCFSRAAYLRKIILPDSYVIKEEVPPNILNQDGNSLSVALYVYTAVNAVDVKPTNENYVSENGILYSKDKKSLWYIPNQYSGNIEVAGETERLEKGCVFIASKGNTNWGNIYLPSNIGYVHRDTAEFIFSYLRGYYYGRGDGVFLYGDMNNDNKADRADAVILLRNISGMGSLTRPGDYNLDGDVNIADVIALMGAI